MKEYKGINIQYTHECPKCENYDIQTDDNYCKICGLNLKNQCISCNMELDSSARYCTQCGHITTYFQAGLLSDWNDVSGVVDQSSYNNDFITPITKFSNF